MKLEWDEQKQTANLEKHGVDFLGACNLWKSTMLIAEDKRLNYGEKRWIGMGLLRARVMVVVFTKHRFNTIRIISFRKANQREVNYYEQLTSQKNKNNSIYTGTSRKS